MGAREDCYRLGQKASEGGGKNTKAIAASERARHAQHPQWTSRGDGEAVWEPTCEREETQHPSSRFARIGTFSKHQGDTSQQLFDRAVRSRLRGKPEVTQNRGINR